MQYNPYLREACVESLQQSLRACRQGADRLELCGDLSVGGITPAPALIEQVLAAVAVPVRVMLRHRGGDFFYDPQDYAQLLQQARMLRSVGVKEVVSGMLTTDRSLNLRLIADLLDINPDWHITIHKAIDEAADPVAEVARLAALPASLSVLSSGAAPTAVEGLDCLSAMLAAAGERVELVACGKVTADNLAALHARLGAKAYHGRLIVGDIGS
jgi:copper homeostasis protein